MSQIEEFVDLYQTSNGQSENGVPTGDLCGGKAIENSSEASDSEDASSLLSLFEFSEFSEYLSENLSYPFDMSFMVDEHDPSGKSKNWFYPCVFLAIAGWFFFMSIVCYALSKLFRACYRRATKQPNPSVTIDQFREEPRSLR